MLTEDLHSSSVSVNSMRNVFIDGVCDHLLHGISKEEATKEEKNKDVATTTIVMSTAPLET